MVGGAVVLGLWVWRLDLHYMTTPTQDQQGVFALNTHTQKGSN